MDRCTRERIRAVDGPTEKVVSLESCVDVSGEVLTDTDTVEGSTFGAKI